MSLTKEWDEHYAGDGRIWSGNPNHLLVQEIFGMVPGTCLDVGCGEGADAIWLVGQGWQVTGVDVSLIALERARHAAEAVGAEVNWVQSSLEDLDADLGDAPARFDLVSAFYPPILKTDDHRGEQALLRAVAPGGLLLFVAHEMSGHEPHPDQRFNPDDYVDPALLARYLAEQPGWTIEVHEVRDRQISGGAGAHHREDVVIRARRMP